MALPLEEEEVNPVRHRLHLSTSDYVRTLLLGVTLLPFRLCGLLSCFVLAWAVASVGMVGADLSHPLVGWQAFARHLVALLGRLSMFFCGFHHVQVKGRQCSRKEAPVLVAAPHSSFFDAIVIFCSGFPIFVNREENRAYPWIGLCMEFIQSIFVSREEAGSRQKAAAAIKERVCSSEDWPQVIIFPEGTCSNRAALMQYRPGAFIPGVAVQPVLVRYSLDGKADTVTWTWDQTHGAIACILLTLTQWSTEVSIQFLPPYLPSQEEKDNPQLFADNVRQLMAKHLQVPLCPLSFKEAQLKFGGKKMK